ncbi:uncharacterized protein FOBCDRAFT_261370 [Fusarium oxysporum Fo47]|nr:uncharacterized protein FOBCDRAFT_261370 [Fusarium oxysporum Fo47]WJG35394.1 hypothetical protein FOBCDRAFT_261370 [Fusarium oxysporum Fo47]
MASGKGQQMGPLALETVLQDWVVSHAGRLWLTTEELTTIIDQAGFTKPQVTNWHFFATFAENGYLPEAGKSLIAGSTGLSTRSIVDLFDKLRRDARFSTAATTIAKQAYELQPFDVPNSQPSTSSKVDTRINSNCAFCAAVDTITISGQPARCRYSLSYPCYNTVLSDFIFAIERIPFKENGLVNFEILGATAMKHFPPQPAGEFRCLYCDRSYKDAYLLSAHLLSHTGPFFICSIPNCRANVGEIRMTHRNIQYHMEEHMKRKDIENRLIYPPYKPDATDHWQRTPQEIQEHITQLMTQRAKIDTAERDTLPGMEEKESNKRTNHWFKFIKQQAAALAEEGMERVMAISEDTQAQVLAYNLD